MFKSTPILIAAGLLCLTAPAFAGHWEVHYECAGHSTGSTPTADAFDWPSPTTKPPRYPAADFDTSDINIFPQDEWATDSLKLENDGKVTAVFRWVADGPNDVAPEFLSVKEAATAKATADAEGIHGTVAPPTISTNNGLGNKPDAVDQHGNVGFVSTGAKLSRWPVSKGVVRLSARILKATVEVPEGTDYGELRAFVQYEATVDNRSVKLTRNGKDRFELKDGSWTTYGKTCYSYKTPTAANGIYRVLQPFTANYFGNWSDLAFTPRITWKWSSGSPLESAGDLDYIYSAKRRSPLGGLTQESYATGAFGEGGVKWKGTGTSSQTATITYDAEDQGDGAKASASYILEIHEPIEKENESTTVVWAYTPVWGSGAMPGNPNGVMQPNGPITPNQDGNPEVTVGHGESRGVAITVSGELGIEAVAGALGVSMEWNYEQSSSVDQSQAVNVAVPVDYFTYPVFEDKYIRHFVTYRHFTEEGEHEMPSVEFPLGSGYIDTPIHEIEIDEPSGRTLTWAPPQPISTGRVPMFTTTPSEPTPYRSGGRS